MSFPFSGAKIFLALFLVSLVTFPLQTFAISLFNVCAPDVTCLIKVDSVGITTAKLLPSYLIQAAHSQEYYQSANWWIEYGTDPLLNNRKTTSPQSSSSKALTDGLTISGLSSGTKYYARLAVISEPSGLKELGFKSEIVFFTTEQSSETPTPTATNNPNHTPTPTTTPDTLIVEESPTVIISSTGSSGGGGGGGGSGGGSGGGGGGATTAATKKIFTVVAGKNFKISAKPAAPKVKKVTTTVFGKTYPMVAKKGVFTATVKAPTKLGKYNYAIKFSYAEKTVVKKDILQVVKPPAKKAVVKTTPKPTVTPIKVLGAIDTIQSDKPWYQNIVNIFVGIYHLLPWTY